MVYLLLVVVLAIAVYCLLRLMALSVRLNFLERNFEATKGNHYSMITQHREIMQSMLKSINTITNILSDGRKY